MDAAGRTPELDLSSMQTIPICDDDLARLAAREHVLRFLAVVASDPTSARFIGILRADPQLALAGARYIAEDPGSRPAELAPGEDPPERLDLAPIVAALRAPRQRLVDDHTRVFGLVVSKECPPYEVQYCPQTFAVFRSQQMADIAGFYRAFGVETGRDVPERVDHIASELEFLAWLVAKERHALGREGEEWRERAAICRDAQRDFLAEHLAWWVPTFARALADHAGLLDPPAPLYTALAHALASLVPAERALLDVEPPRELASPRPEAESGVAEGCTSCTSTGDP